MKKIFPLVAVLACLGLTASLALAYDVPTEIVIKRPDKNPPLASWVGPVTFPHGYHAAHNACLACHHEESDASLGKYLRCTQCHNSAASDEITGFYRAWHSAKAMSCLGCHKMKRYTGQATPPLSCVDGCHKLPEGGGK